MLVGIVAVTAFSHNHNVLVDDEACAGKFAQLAS